MTEGNTAGGRACGEKEKPRSLQGKGRRKEETSTLSKLQKNQTLGEI